jgi:hypothetical protein
VFDVRDLNERLAGLATVLIPARLPWRALLTEFGKEARPPLPQVTLTVQGSGEILRGSQIQAP